MYTQLFVGVLRASPTICQILLGKNLLFCQLIKGYNKEKHLQEFAKFYLANLVFCQLLKDMSNKKRVHLQQFGIVHLGNSNLT
jgi:hypothetical protein